MNRSCYRGEQIAIPSSRSPLLTLSFTGRRHKGENSEVSGATGRERIGKREGGETNREPDAFWRVLFPFLLSFFTLPHLSPLSPPPAPPFCYPFPPHYFIASLCSKLAFCPFLLYFFPLSITKIGAALAHETLNLRIAPFLSFSFTQPLNH